MMIGGPGYKKPDKGMRSRPEGGGDGGDDGGGGKDVSEERKPGLAGMGRVRFAKNVLAAIRDDDAEALDQALADHYEACAAEE